MFDTYFNNNDNNKNIFNIQEPVKDEYGKSPSLWSTTTQQSVLDSSINSNSSFALN